jgi:type VII secretion integral membrane protein EccD
MTNAAAKLSIVLTGLSPRMPSSVDATADEIPLPAAVGTLRAARGHQTLTGLLAAFSLSAALGVALVAADQHNHVTWSSIAFTGAVSVALVLRAVQQRGSVRSATILTAGFVSTTAGFTLLTLSAPRQAPWLGLFAMIVGASTLCLTLADVGERLSPFVRRGIEVVDYLALAAVVPLACWVGGLFGFVRGLSLT